MRTRERIAKIASLIVLVLAYGLDLFQRSRVSH